MGKALTQIVMLIANSTFVIKFKLHILSVPFHFFYSQFSVFDICSYLNLSQFEKWADSQRKQVLQDFFSRCSVSQLKYLRQTLDSCVPEDAVDFTRVLPRVISLYIFSFLDPRSLCRCGQVCYTLHLHLCISEMLYSYTFIHGIEPTTMSYRKAKVFL